jgi:hypothetical protein
MKDKAECGDRKVAAFGPPGAITIFSAATGVSVLAPAGFAAVAAAGIAVGVLTVIAGGAAAATRHDVPIACSQNPACPG